MATAGLRRSTARHLVGVGLVLGGAVAIAAGLGGWSPAQGAVALALFVGVAVAVQAGLAAHRPHAGFGAANLVTLVRAAGVCAFAASILAPPVGALAAWAATAAAAVLALLDLVDGWIARRWRLASPFGARFDMETDAAFILVLGAVLAAQGRVGPWILAAGALRYLFVAAGRFWPALAAPLPPSERRRLACAIQVGTLVAALAPALGPGLAGGLAAFGLALTLASFAVDTIWLLRRSAKGSPACAAASSPPSSG